jgi:DNA replication ATP-dependent helicase/nuclease Dna2
MEEQDVVRFRKELWTLTAEERERKGRCFGKMKVQDYRLDTGPGVAKMHRHVYRFVRATTSSVHVSSASTPKSPGGFISLLNGNISAGDAITVSIEPNLFAIARGFAIELESDHIDVGFDHEVNLSDILRRSQNINGVLGNIVCRLDKDEFASGLGRIRDNLARLFYANGDTKRLSLVVDLVPPLFDDQYLPEELELPQYLNPNQRDAVRKVLSAKDYAMVLGMPGTGKTSTVAEIINILVKRGKTVLLASYTHSAVDTILLKLSCADYPILRLGSLDKVRRVTSCCIFCHF